MTDNDPKNMTAEEKEAAKKAKAQADADDKAMKAIADAEAEAAKIIADAQAKADALLAKGTEKARKTGGRIRHGTAGTLTASGDGTVIDQSGNEIGA